MSRSVVVFIVAHAALFAAPIAQAGGAAVPASKLLLPRPLSAVVQPTTRPANEPAAHQLGDADAPLPRLGETTIGQLFQGTKTITPNEAIAVRFWLSALKDLVFTAAAFLPRLVVSLIVFLIFYGLYRVLRRLLIGGVSKAHLDPSVRDMLSSLLKWGIVGFGVVLACNQMGLQVGGLLAGTAIAGLAIGFAAQETLANLIACLVIFWDKPFKVGDWIDVDGRYGKVLRITFRSTRLLSGDGEVLIVPNTMMLSSKLGNRSTNDLCRVKVPIHVSYRTSIDDARAVLLSLAEHDARIVAEPAPAVWVAQCGDFAIHLALGFWIADESAQKKMEAEYLEKAIKAFANAGIEIPYPHTQVVVDDRSLTQFGSGLQLRRAG